MAHTRIKTSDFDVYRYFLIVEQLFWQLVKALDQFGLLDFLLLNWTLIKLFCSGLADRRVDVGELDALLWKHEKTFAENFEFLLVKHEILKLGLKIGWAFFVLLLHFSGLHSDHVENFMFHGLVHG